MVAWKSSTSFYLHDKYATFYAHYFAPLPQQSSPDPSTRESPPFLLSHLLSHEQAILLLLSSSLLYTYINIYMPIMHTYIYLFTRACLCRYSFSSIYFILFFIYFYFSLFFFILIRPTRTFNSWVYIYTHTHTLHLSLSLKPWYIYRIVCNVAPCTDYPSPATSVDPFPRVSFPSLITKVFCTRPYTAHLF